MVSGMVLGGASEFPEGHFGLPKGVIFGRFWGPQSTKSELGRDFAVIFAQSSVFMWFGAASVVIFATKNA